MTLAFHLYLPQMRMSHETIVERALAAEATGFEGIAFMDHLVPPLASEHDMWEAMSIATWVLARTQTLLVGHLVLCDSFRHPAVLARQATSLDHASGGRFELGLGWGSTPDELVTFGVTAGGARDRVGRLEESLAIIRRLWTGDVVDHDGEHFQLRGAQQRPTPSTRIPITIGGVGSQTLRLVSEHADWWNVPVHELDALDTRRGDAGNARISVQVLLALAPTAAELPNLTERMARRFGGGPLGRMLVVGTPATVAEQMVGFRERGVERIYVWFADFAPDTTLHSFGEVIAAVR